MILFVVQHICHLETRTLFCVDLHVVPVEPSNGSESRFCFWKRLEFLWCLQFKLVCCVWCRMLSMFDTMRTTWDALCFWCQSWNKTVGFILITCFGLFFILFVFISFKVNKTVSVLHFMKEKRLDWSLMDRPFLL